MKGAQRQRDRPSILALPLELKQQICGQVLLDIIHNELSNVEKSTDLEEHYRKFRSQAHSLTLVPGFTFANEWAKKTHRPLKTFYVTVKGLYIDPILGVRYENITGTNYGCYVPMPLSSFGRSGKPVRLIIDQRSDGYWGNTVVNILRYNSCIGRYAKNLHLIIIRRPQYYNIGSRFENDIECCMIRFLRPWFRRDYAGVTEIQFELRSHGQSSSYHFRKQLLSTGPPSYEREWELVREQKSFDKNGYSMAVAIKYSILHKIKLYKKEFESALWRCVGVRNTYLRFGTYSFWKEIVCESALALIKLAKDILTL